jgi:membrane protein
MMSLKDIWNLIRQTITEWSEDKAPRLAAALAYYTAFSLAPILVIAIAVAGLFLEQPAVRQQVVAEIDALAGQQGAELVDTLLAATQDFGDNWIAIILGVVALVFGATGVFGQLQDALNTMWEVALKPDRGFKGVIKDRLFSFTMVVSLGFLLLVSLVISAGLAALEAWMTGLIPGLEVVMQVIAYFVTFLVVALVFALVFKYVPDAEIEWRDVWLGAGVTAVLFLIGQAAIGFYLGNAEVVAQFGAAGSLVVILLWVYYSAQISFLGAEFTQVYANQFGSRVVPAEHAVKVTEEVRAQQGIPHKETMEKSAQRRAEAEGESGTATQPAPAQSARRPALTFSSIVIAVVGLAAGFLLGRSGRS